MAAATTTPHSISHFPLLHFHRRFNIHAAASHFKLPAASSHFKLPASSSHGFKIHASSGGGSNGGSDSNSYLDMWKKAADRDRRTAEFRRLDISPAPPPETSEEEIEKKTETFNQIISVPREERDRVQRLQVIDRAAAAIAAAKALLNEKKETTTETKMISTVGSRSDGGGGPTIVSDWVVEEDDGNGSSSKPVLQAGDSYPYQRETPSSGTPGPDFWSWLPPPDSSSKPTEIRNGLKPAQEVDSSSPSSLLMEKEQSDDALSLPLESSLFEGNQDRSLPPFQSLIELETVDEKTSLVSGAEEKLEEQFSKNAAEAAEALNRSEEAAPYGVNVDGSRWWKETGIEQRPDGVVCKWTLIRGVSADGAVEWENKFWEAPDRFDHKELGSEKSGRDAAGNVWREYWKESMWQDVTTGLTHMEKTADKWGKNGTGDEWQEKWLEHYDSFGRAEKWAHKWCSIDPMTPLDAGHAHIWHERWGETYDGLGGSMKYTDKWAERSEGDGWSKWGDKWDENFDEYGNGVKQGETWWQGKYGDRWNRTWGEGHNGSGWVHKYGKSSSGEHWDTHEPQETWYERFPHFGFEHCFNNSVQLRAVPKRALEGS